MDYNYSPELKPQQRIPEIDPGKPAMAGMLKILNITAKKNAASFVPPAGTVIRRDEIMTSDGESITCYVIEKEGSRNDSPAILMIHGGAFYMTVQTPALVVAGEYAARTGAKVFVPDYRLVPKYKAPVQLNDCFDVWQYICKNHETLGVDSKKIALCGDSAGATLAAGLCMRLSECDGIRPAGMMLVYPVLDNRIEIYDSYQRYPETGWSETVVRAMWNAYLPPEKDGDPSLVPMRCTDLGVFPPTYIEPQEIDVFRDEALAFAEKLKTGGVPCEVNLVNGSYHAFDNDIESPLVQRTIEHRADVLKKFLAGNV